MKDFCPATGGLPYHELQSG